MNKEVRKVNGKYQFLLGKKDGEKYWLEKASFDCEWYWGIGYVESYRGNGSSDRSWTSHQHFDGLFLKPAKFVEGFKEFFDETPFNSDEIWEILELMQSAYTCRKYSDMLHTGGSHITSRVRVDLIKNDAEYGRLNNAVIPTILNTLYKILAPEDASTEVFHELKTLVSWGDEED